MYKKAETGDHNDSPEIASLAELLDRIKRDHLQLDAFLKIAVDLIKRHLKVEDILIYQCDRESNLSHYPLDHREMDPGRENIAATEIPFLFTAIRSSRVKYFPSIHLEPSLASQFHLLFNLELKSAAIYPFRLNKFPTMVLFVFSQEKTGFTRAEKQYLELNCKILETGLFVINLQNRTDKMKSKSQSGKYDFLNSVLNQLNFGIMVLDDQLRVQYMNSETIKLFQLSQNQRQYNKLENVLGRDNTQTILATREHMKAAYERPEIELVNNGEKTTIGFTITNLTAPGGDRNGFVLLFKDITYSKESQQEIQRMDRLASLGVMASGIAHEIRNPLAGIKAIAQTFEEELSKSDPKIEYVVRIIKQVNRLDELLKSLFSYAKPQKPNRQFHSVREILGDVLSLLQQKIQNQQIRLNYIYETDIPLIFIDNSQIQQVLFNLILNSIESIEGKGEINITVGRVRKSIEHLQRKPFLKGILENPYLQILISDTGCGISEENLQEIFNPFYTTKSFGTGLGLSIVYQIVQENYGIIYFESEVGEGTDCYLFLPAFNPNKNSKTE